MPHVLLLGDSVFDNASYVPGGRPVIEQVRAGLPRGWGATLLAADGAVCASVASQVGAVPADTSHVFVSVGGNDALRHSGMLEEPDRAAPELLAALTAMQLRFRQDYRDMLRRVVGLGLPTVVCTIYDAVPGLVTDAVTLLSLFNDVILREAARQRTPVIELRLVCDEAKDYSTVSPIEPSEQGGQKIADRIVYAATTHDFARQECVVFGK